MGTPGNQAIVRRGVENNFARAEVRYAFSKGVVEIGSENPGPSAKQVGIGRGGAAKFLTRHGMTAEKRTAPQTALCLVHNHLFGASRIGDQGVRADEGVELPKCFENAGDGLREKQ